MARPRSRFRCCKCDDPLPDNKTLICGRCARANNVWSVPPHLWPQPLRDKAVEEERRRVESARLLIGARLLRRREDQVAVQEDREKQGRKLVTRHFFGGIRAIEDRLAASIAREQLSEGDRELLTLHDWGYTEQEIGDMLRTRAEEQGLNTRGFTQAAISRKLHRAMRRYLYWYDGDLGDWVES